MPRIPGHRYDLPASRLIHRGLRYARQWESSRSAQPAEPDAARPRPERARAWLADLVWLRLAEDRGLLPPHFFRERSDRFPAVLAELNHKLGFLLFDPELYTDWDSEPESLKQTRMSVLLAWDRELHLRRFWPEGMPIEVLALLAEFWAPARQAGRYWTPAGMVDRLLEWTLGTLPGKARAEFTLLDPACGAGLFLLAALRRLIAAEAQRISSRAPDLFAPVPAGPAGGRGLTPARRLELFSGRIFGVDEDGQALEAARRGLLLLILEGENLIEPTISLGAQPALALFQNLRQGDSLVDRPIALQESLFQGSEARRRQPFLWSDPEQGFGKILGRGGFDAIVGNPPWGSLKGKQLRPPYPAEVVDYLVRRYRTEAFRPSLFEMFIRRSLELLAEDGSLALVVPERLVSHPHYRELRRFLAEQKGKLRLHQGEAFPGLAETAVCLGFQKTGRPRKTAWIEVSDRSGRVSALSLSQWVRADRMRVGAPAPLAASDSEIKKMLDRIAKAGKPLGEFLESGGGVIARPGRITPNRVSPTQSGVARGEHVHPYYREGRSYLEFTARNLAGGTRRVGKLTRKDRILVRKIGARLAATLDDSGDLIVQSLFFLHLRDRRLCRGYDLRYFLGILNSHLLSFYYRQRLAGSRGAAPQLQKVLLDRLPIPALKLRLPADLEKHRQLVALVQQRLQAGASPSPELEAEIELQVAKLYGLKDAGLTVI